MARGWRVHARMEQPGCGTSSPQMTLMLPSQGLELTLLDFVGLNPDPACYLLHDSVVPPVSGIPVVLFRHTRVSLRSPCVPISGTGTVTGRFARKTRPLGSHILLFRGQRYFSVYFVTLHLIILLNDHKFTFQLASSSLKATYNCLEPCRVPGTALAFSLSLGHGARIDTVSY
jgi:hypothetical protein